ncbi:MAG: hypothetical protein IKM34_08380 [Clostridia bacterium]|nr:hypothetical protein [Clostridia bacterium]
MKKQSLLLLLTLLLATLLFTVACGSNETATTPSVTTQTPTTTTSNQPNVTTPVVTTPSVPTVTTPADTTDTKPTLQDPISVKLMTFNLRYDTTSHPCMSTEVRGAQLMEVIQKYMPDSVSFCEATNDWMKYLRVEMKKLGYEGVGVGRDSGATGDHLSGTGNEHSPVFYRADKYELVDSDTFWLSTNPAQKGSVSWNSACKRVCSYAVLKEKETGSMYAHFGTHLDHKSIPAQYNGVMVIETYIKAVLEEYGNIGIALSGDFNCVRFDKSNPSYVPTTYNTVSSFMDDSRDLATKKGVDGASWSGYQSPTDWAQGHVSMNDKPAVDTTSSPIDYIFLQKGTATVSYYTIVDDVFTFEYNGKTWYNHPISDHYGVYCEATFTKPSSKLTYTEDSIVVYPADITISDKLPTALEGATLLNDKLTITSSLNTQASNKIENLLLNDNSQAGAFVSGRKYGFWEIIMTAKDPSEIKGISVTTAEASAVLPQTLRIFISENGTDWFRVGGTVAEPTASSTYYIIPEQPITTTYVKVLFSDTAHGAKLVNVSLYGEVKSTGRIDNADITLISGPNEAGSKEGYGKMFDDNISTKFYIRLYKDAEVPANPDPVGAICFSTKNPTTIASYTLTNANDTASHTGRIPRGWTLYGSVTGEENSYEIIDQVTNPTISTVNYETFTFSVDTPKEYQYYQLVFEVGKTGNVQFSEIAFFESVK